VVRPPEPEPPPPAAPPKPVLGTVTGLPLPRFAALGSNQVNLRIGPDLRYRIEWTYQRRDLPVQIIEEHQIWRKIRDPEGTEGWVQRPLLNARRTFLVQGEGERTLRRRPEPDASPVAHLKPGVIGLVRRCEAGSAWCEVRVGDHSGWVRRSEIWGVAADEAIE
jgi:SH3-like domain-containing protein